MVGDRRARPGSRHRRPEPRLHHRLCQGPRPAGQPARLPAARPKRQRHVRERRLPAVRHHGARLDRHTGSDVGGRRHVHVGSAARGASRVLRAGTRCRQRRPPGPGHVRGLGVRPQRQRPSHQPRHHGRLDELIHGRPDQTLPDPEHRIGAARRQRRSEHRFHPGECVERPGPAADQPRWSRLLPEHAPADQQRQRRHLRLRRSGRSARVPLPLVGHLERAGHRNTRPPHRTADSQQQIAVLPQVATGNTQVDVQLPRIAFRSTVPWPDRSDKPGHAAALACITAALGLPAPIESNYSNEMPSTPSRPR